MKLIIILLLLAVTLGPIFLLTKRPTKSKFSRPIKPTKYYKKKHPKGNKP